MNVTLEMISFKNEEKSMLKMIIFKKKVWNDERFERTRKSEMICFSKIKDG